MTLKINALGMKLSLTLLPSSEHELACDEALLDACEGGSGAEVLRFWQPREMCVVVGYANHVADEVNLSYCRARSIPVLRRCTGGGTVLQAPGCLNYSLVFQVPDDGPLRTITSTNRFIMERHRAALGSLTGLSVRVEGFTDLAVNGRKFSGNSQRRKMRSILFHGCFLLQADLDLIEKSLRMPSRQPGYRQHRSHNDFLMNLKIPAQSLIASLSSAWNATEVLEDPPVDQIDQLVKEKYRRPEWNLRF